MAEIRLKLREAEGDLPDVCMRCGEDSTIVKAKKMSWCPPWVGILILGGLIPYVIVAMIMTKHFTVQVPLCDKHKGHWLNRTLLTVGTFFLFAFIGGGAFALAAMMNQGGGRRGDDFLGMACVLSAVLGLVWLIILIAAQNTAIRPKEITDRDITLAGVAQEFVDAVDEERYDDRPSRSRRGRDDFDDDEDEAPRAKKKRPPIDDEDDEPKPRKKRPPSDAIEE